MERVIYYQLLSYLRRHNLIKRAQHGFLLSGRSTFIGLSKRLTLTINNKLINNNNKLINNMAYIDFAKTCDSVCHDKLFHKL